MAVLASLLVCAEDANPTGPPQRPEGRAVDALRPTELLPGWLSAPLASVLVRQGQTWVLCTVTAENRLPRWMRRKGRGWLTATYSMLPGSTDERTRRERRGARGRTREIERMIGRALRSAVDFERLGERTLHVDCDVLQADGGTRTAAVTGGWLALALAARSLRAREVIDDDPVVRQVAAVSVGVVDDRPLLDLEYVEDVRAETDMNVVMTADGQFVELQGTAEGVPFAADELDRMLALATDGIATLVAKQQEALGGI